MPSQTLSILSLIFGIISAFFFWIPLLGLVFPILSIVFGIIFLSNKKNKEGKGLAIAGIIIGGVFGFFSLLVLIIPLFTYSMMSSYIKDNSNYELNENYSQYSKLEIVDLYCYNNEKGNIEYGGKVINNGKYTEMFVQVNISFYDENKNKIGEDFSYIEGDTTIKPSKISDFHSYNFDLREKVDNCSAGVSGMFV